LFPTLFEIGPLTVSSFGFLMACAVGVGVYMGVTRLDELGYDPHRSFRMLAGAVLAGLLSARLWDVMEDVFRDSALSVADVPGMLLRGGLTWYGGLLGGLLVLGLLSRAVGVRVLTVFNAIAPGLAVSQAIGRFGCFLVGDDYGKPTDSWVGIPFPDGLPPTTVPVHPTQLYEMTWLFLAGAWLWRRRDRSPSLFGEYLMLAGAGRWTVEWFRLNPPLLGPFSQAQVVAMTAIAVGAWLYSRGTPEQAAS
jgi:phosphatidylglycerol:prolipoprotein diacylglycerol transferase